MVSDEVWYSDVRVSRQECIVFAGGFPLYERPEPTEDDKTGARLRVLAKHLGAAKLHDPCCASGTTVDTVTAGHESPHDPRTLQKVTAATCRDRNYKSACECVCVRFPKRKAPPS